MILQSQRSNLIIITYFIIYSFFIQNINSKLFPSDFFDPILPEKDEKEAKETNNNDSNKNKNNLGGSKSIYVSLQKEYEEDKELIDLLSSSKSKRNLFYIIIFLHSSYQQWFK